MLAEVKTIGRVDVLDAGFMRLGYEPMGEFGIPGRRYFRKDSVVGGERQRTHQLHVFAHSDRENVVRASRGTGLSAPASGGCGRLCGAEKGAGDAVSDGY